MQEIEPEDIELPNSEDSVLDKDTLSVLLMFYLNLVTQVCRHRPTSNIVQQVTSDFLYHHHRLMLHKVAHYQTAYRACK